MAELLCRASDPEWLDLRRKGITATDITVIAGLVGWDSPWCLFWRKRGLLPEREVTDRMIVGQWLETGMCQRWSETSGKDIMHGGLYQSSDRPWQLATPDRVTWNDGPLEVKTWDQKAKDQWGPDGSDQVPAHVRAQVLWQMDTLGVGTGHVAVCFLPSGEFRSYTIEHTPRAQEFDDCPECQETERLRQQGREFWRRLQGELPPPDVDGLAVTTAGLKRLYADPSATLRAELPQALLMGYDNTKEAVARARADMKRLEELARKGENLIREALGDALVGTVDGRPVIERRFGKRAGYTVPPLETDQLKRTKEKDSGEASESA